MFSNQVLKLPHYYRPGDMHTASNLDFSEQRKKTKQENNTKNKTWKSLHSSENVFRITAFQNASSGMI